MPEELAAGLEEIGFEERVHGRWVFHVSGFRFHDFRSGGFL
jgi:hypothetical protein